MLLVIAVITLTVSIVMSGIAWRLTREERRRSQARIAVLASDLTDLEPLPGSAPGIELFRAEQPAHSGSRFAVVLTVGGVAVATALALLVVTSRHMQSASGPQGPVKVRPESAPLELLALGHELQGNRMIVRGVVRNPDSGVERDRVAVAVFLFDRDGSGLAGGLAAVETPALAPGAQSAFVVTVPHTTEVARYRVSFRSDDRILPHVDRRERQPTAQPR
jgi:hypothetical protein